jgi:hypothetical protein
LLHAGGAQDGREAGLVVADHGAGDKGGADEDAEHPHHDASVCTRMKGALT